MRVISIAIASSPVSIASKRLRITLNCDRIEIFREFG